MSQKRNREVSDIGNEIKTRKKKEKDLGGEGKRTSMSKNLPLGWASVVPTLLKNRFVGQPSKKIAAFDLDGTIVVTKTKSAFPKDENDYRVFNQSVPERLKALERDGHRIVILSNQGGIKGAIDGKQAQKVMKRIDRVLEEIGISCTVLLSTSKDVYRKPDVGMWKHFLEECNGGMDVDMSDSFYVGDAAGREGDFADTDREFAKNASLPFKTPEDVFGPRQDTMAKNKDNLELVRIFHDLSELETDPFKRRAFEKVSSVLMDCKDAISSGKQAMSMPGIGKGSAGIIDEYLNTGKVEALEKLVESKTSLRSKEELAGLHLLD